MPIDFDHIEKVFTEASACYQNAQPFPHAAFEGLFDTDYL